MPQGPSCREWCSVFFFIVEMCTYSRLGYLFNFLIYICMHKFLRAVSCLNKCKPGLFFFALFRCNPLSFLLARPVCCKAPPEQLLFGQMFGDVQKILLLE
uniref:Uncharacterized protein n=1 Tax=Rhipicephalus zambeziensis TaxID=60191 RepID=A0A224YL98_9ACAR